MEAVGDREYRVPLVPLLEASDKGHGNPLEASNEGNSLKAGGGVGDRIPLVICLEASDDGGDGSPQEAQQVTPCED